MSRTALCLAAALLAGPAMARTFEWVSADPTDISLNPAFLRTSLALTVDDEPVRATLVSVEEAFGPTLFGDVRLDQLSDGGTTVWSLLLEGKVHVQNLAVFTSGAIILHGTYRHLIEVGPDHSLSDASGAVRDFLLRLDENHDVDFLIDYQDANPNVFGIGTIVLDAFDRAWIGVSLGSGTQIRRLDSDGGTAEVYVQDRALHLSSLSFESDGSLWATGFTSSGLHTFQDLEAQSPFGYAMYLVRYAPNGSGQWVHFIEDVTSQSPRVVADGNGAAYFAGSLHGEFAFGDLIPEGVDYVYDFFLTKVDAVGEFLWLREVPADGLTGDAGIGNGPFLAANSDGVIFGGFSRLSVDWTGQGDVPPSWGGHDALVLGLSPEGSVLWSKTAGAVGFDIADGVAVTASGDVFVAGHVSEGAQFDDQFVGSEWLNHFIAKLVDETPTSAPVPMTVPVSSVWPNPFRDSATLRFRLDRAGPAHVTVFGVAGDRVADFGRADWPAGWNEWVWNPEGRNGRRLPAGVYHYVLTADEGTTHGTVTLLR